jgi:hypothetical protein
MAKQRKKKLFCIHNHDISIIGRNSSGHCNGCPSSYDPIVAKAYREQHKEKYKEHGKNWRKNNKDKNAERVEKWRLQNSEYLIKYQREYDAKRSEKRKITDALYRKKHPEIYKLASTKRDIKRGKRIVKFGQRGISTFYRKCFPGYQIDHIVPLLGKKVSGLHVRWNLQYLTQEENIHKGNKVDLLEVSRWYGKLLEKEGLK